MKFTVTEDRKVFVGKLAEALGVEKKYMGPPSFAFQVGPYTVGKTGTIEVDDSEADLDLLRDLGAGEPIEEALGDDAQLLGISVPIGEHTPQTLINLLHTFCSWEKIINHAIGSGHNFLMNKKLVKALDDETPESLKDFFKKLDEFGGRDANRGLIITKNQVSFQFPFTQDPERVETYTKFVELINQMALTQQRVVSGSNHSNNEKYAFRVWLVRLGMVGPEYKTARSILLRNLSGNSAFRTEDQKEAALEKLKAKREETKKCSEYQEL